MSDFFSLGFPWGSGDEFPGPNWWEIRLQGMNQSMARNNEAEERTDAMFGEMDYLAHSVCHFMAGDVGCEWSWRDWLGWLVGVFFCLAASLKLTDILLMVQKSGSPPGMYKTIKPYEYWDIFHMSAGFLPSTVSDSSQFARKFSHPKREKKRIVFQASIFRGTLAVSFKGPGYFFGWLGGFQLWEGACQFIDSFDVLAFERDMFASGKNNVSRKRYRP